MSTDLTPEQVEEISNSLAMGNKIEAIKIYREATGLCLKESKDFIDALIPQLKQQDPVRYAKANEVGAVSCGVKVLMFLFLGGLGIWAVRLLA
jgi:ribosomal protein L7/L12